MARFEDMLALRRMNEELQASNAELDAFAHTVAHDLQSPLSLLSGFGEMMLLNYDDYPVEQHIDVLDKIMRTANKMSTIVSELLLLSSVRQMDVALYTLDMTRVVDEALQRLADEIKAANAEIILPASWLPARSYGPWIEEVWFNYLSNAIKYGGSPPRLELGVSEQPDGMLCFWVKDNGRGLTAVEQDELFIPFTKLSQARAKGHGLGLSIVRRITERLGGRAGVTSEVGAGSSFWFVLPPADPAPNTR
jgi:signal transduction histidine kinase